MKRKIISALMTIALATSMLSGCGSKNEKVSITIGNWPTKEQTSYEVVQKRLEEFKTAHPEWDVETSEFVYDTKSFTTTAAGGRLPTVWAAPFTEIELIADAGYCADISDNIKEIGLDKIINPELLELVTGENGEIWGLPHGAYAQGLTINKKLFKEAGLVNADGTIMVPKTYDELAEFAATIKEKTGKAGFTIPTMSNQGGWNFINIAWSYGTEFMKQGDDGKWIATFDSDEFKSALKWLYDMKWVHNAFPDDNFVDHNKRMQYLGTYQAAMTIAGPVEQSLVTKYDMDMADIACTRLPEGPAGRFSQTGGAVEFFDANATDDEINAALRWYVEYGGFAMEIDEETVKKEEEATIASLEAGKIVLPKLAFPDFINRDGEEKLDEIRQKYANVDYADYSDYYSFDNVALRAEEPVCCQQLYAVMDSLIQEILTNKDVDIDEAVAIAVNDFQKNHLDNL